MRGQTFWKPNLIFLDTYDECHPIVSAFCTCGCHLGRDSVKVAIVLNPNLCCQQDVLEVDLHSSREKVTDRSGEDKTYI